MVCNGQSNGSATVTPVGGNGGNTFLWDDGEITATATKLNAGTHSVTVTDTKNCTTSCSVVINENNCAHIFPTATTCCNYLAGPTSVFQLLQVCTTVSGGIVGNAIPGVFFYYGDYTAPVAGTTTIVVKQSRNTASTILKPFDPQNLSNVRLLVDNCISVTPTSILIGTGANSGNVTITFNAVAGKKYIVSVKYDVKSIIGSTAPAGTATYSFAMFVNGSATASSGSTGSVNVVSGCTDNTPLPSGACPAAARIAFENTGGKGTMPVDGLSIAAYPNPYHDAVNFQFVSPKSGKASLEVYDILGRRLAIIYQGYIGAGIPMKARYSVPALSRVALFYRLSVDNKIVRGNILPDNIK